MRALNVVSSGLLFCLACTATPLGGLEDDYGRGLAGSSAPSSPTAGRTGGGGPSQPPGMMPPGSGGGPINPGRPVPPDLDGGAPVPPVGFKARVKAGGAVMLETFSIKPLYMLTCSSAFSLEQPYAGSWVPLRDDRPPSYMNPGYFLDGVFVPPSFNEGCDVLTCRPLGPTVDVPLFALEYVQLGSISAPPGSGISGTIPAIESRGRRGDLRLRLNYSEDSNCSRFTEATIDFFVPDGECCYVGPEGCNASNAGGGWTPSPGDCPALFPSSGTYYTARVDGFGCAKLIPDPQRCCGSNCGDEDAGVAP